MDSVNIYNTKYQVIDNFFSEDELKIIQKYTKVVLRETENHTYDPQSPAAPAGSSWSDYLIQSFLENKKDLLEKNTNIKLIPTYGFWRGYVFGSILVDHIDRPSCEISVTVNIDSCGTPWRIHMNDNWFDLQINQGVIYLGNEIKHGRESYFKGDWMPQVFFHYVDANGKNVKHAFDLIEKERLKNAR